eukprot:TRINITY_DN2750_c0_g1_i2.p1 TRINITY_DN2750_c0_g1~~TRINITY_DN2750_c0_g1_i2.p1  ORF type:complete len:122 (-),score=12.67 TRINITY_DN2750_c0_g1_i2:51-416(-)
MSQQTAELIKRKQLIEERLEKTGKRVEFEELLKKKLIETGWKDEMKKYCMGNSGANLRTHQVQGHREDEAGGTHRRTPAQRKSPRPRRGQERTACEDTGLHRKRPCLPKALCLLICLDSPT